ncbi:MAG: HAD family hydrolase [Candidatus Binatia bacterium]
MIIGIDHVLVAVDDLERERVWAHACSSPDSVGRRAAEGDRSGMIHALIFDFDGLILDTELPEFQAWQEVYRKYGGDLPLSTWAVCIGTSADVFDPYDELEAQLGRPVDRDTIRSKFRQRHAELVAAQSVLPGVTDYIADAKRLGLKLGLASSSTRAWVTGYLSRLGLSAGFDCIRCADDVERVKPDPELYHAVLSGLDLRADQAIALEDSPNGILAAKRAGIFCVAVPNALTRQLSLDQADLQLTSLAERPLEKLLLEVMDRWGR